MSMFTVITVLVMISAVFAFINARFFKLPSAIGIITIAVFVSVIAIITGGFFPVLLDALTKLNKNIDFSQTLLNTMLGFLLFAGALRFDWGDLKKQIGAVLVLSTVGVLISTAIFGFMFDLLTDVLKVDIPFAYCLLFGSLISPTDPVAVSAVLKKSKIPQHLSTIITGESLFNDGVGLILFITLLEYVTQSGNDISSSKIGVLFAQEVFGGIALGLTSAFVVYKVMRKVDDFQTLVISSLALVMGISVVAAKLHVSIPLAVVAAGLLIGNKRFGKDPSGKMNDFLERFWTLIDEMMNTILFVMIGLQIVVMPFQNYYWIVGLSAIILALLARALSVFVPLVFLRRTLNLNYNNITILTWAGVRGGVSIALALSMPHTKYQDLILASCYFIIIFSIVVQGLSLNKMIEFFTKKEPLPSPNP